MVTISVTSDLHRFAAGLNEMAQRQVRFAAARALNDVTKGAVEDVKKALPSIFDRPVPFTTNAFYATPVKDKNRLEASVAIREWAPKGTPASKYLAPQILGGDRSVKRFERRLETSALIGARMKMLPARGALLDAYGNPDRRQLGQMMAHMRAFSDTGQNVSQRKLNQLQKRGLLTKTAVGRSKFFVATGKQSGKPIGIWTVLGRGHVQPVYLFASKEPAFKKRFDFDGFFAASYARRFVPAMAARFAEAMASAIAGKGSAL